MGFRKHIHTDENAYSNCVTLHITTAFYGASIWN